MDERHQKLLQLKTFIENTQLNNFWESTGKKEWETFKK